MNAPAILPRRWSPRYRTTKAPINISQAAIYQFLGSAIATATRWYLPSKIAQNRPTHSDHMETEHVCNSVVHPITSETITKYKNLSGDPATQQLWKRAMSLELGRLS